MRIPFLNLLFLCTALAAPIHELDRDRRDSVLQQDGFGTHGLVPVLPRAVAVIPKPSISKPIKPVAPADSLPPPRLDTPETPPITRPDDLSTPKDIPENAPTSKDPPARLTGEAACIVKRNGISKRIPCTPAPVLPPVPDTATIKTYMKIDPDTSLFYAGPSGYHYKALAWKQANAPSYKQFGDWWTDESWKQYYVNRRTPWAVEFDKRASVAMVCISWLILCHRALIRFL